MSLRRTFVMVSGRVSMIFTLNLVESYVLHVNIMEIWQLNSGTQTNSTPL